MKSVQFPKYLALGVGVASLSVFVAAAEIAVPAAGGAPPRLPYGAEDILKLSRAQVSEDIIQNYIANSGTIYNLTPDEIVYLRGEGVSDRVINSMVDQRKRLSEVAAQAAPQPAPAADTASAVNYGATAPVYPVPQPTYVPPPASTLYVMSYPQAASSYYGYSYPYYSGGCYSGYYPYYGGSYGSYWRSPVISFGSRYGSSWGRSHYGGGWGHSRYGGHRR